MKLYVETKVLRDGDSEYVLITSIRTKLPMATKNNRSSYTVYVNKELPQEERLADACQQVAQLTGNENVLIFHDQG